MPVPELPFKPKVQLPPGILKLLSEQEVALLIVQVRVLEPPAEITVGLAVKLTEGIGT